MIFAEPEEEIRRIVVKVQHLSPKAGDVIVLTMASFAPSEAIEQFATAIEEAIDRPDVLLVVGIVGFELDALDEEQMRAHGWVREA